MGTTSTAPLSFKGTSTYSSDFANVISRAVAIASLPIAQLANNQADLNEQSTELTTLDTKFAAMQTAVKAIGTALGGASYKAQLSADKAVDVSIGDGAQEGYFTVDVSSIGAYETSMSAANWDVPEVAGQPTTFTLVLGNRNYSVTAADNSAQSVAKAINANYGDLVQATTVNVAPGDTRISLRSTTLGQTSLDILSVPAAPAPTSLQTQAPEGIAMSQTTASWDASGSPATFTFTVGLSHYTITPDTNSAEDVADAINALDGGQVRASVVDLGTDEHHDYRILMQSTTPGPVNGVMYLDLRKESGPNLQTQQTAATSRTTAAWGGAADPAGSRATYYLVIGTTKYAFTPADNSAASVAEAINSLHGDKVHASIIDLQTGGNPDYRISLQGKTGISYDIQKVTATAYQNEQTAGALATYEINNSGVTNHSTTRHITISTGVTATLVGTTGVTPVGITVTRSTSALNTALSGFADAYNAARTEVLKQQGQSGGALQGQSIVRQLSDILGSISTYSSSGQFTVLENLGLKLETNGQITYSPLTLMSADLTNSAGIASFLGSATEGGFLKTATDALARVEDPVTGLLKTAKTEMTSQIARLATTIADRQAKVDKMQIQMQNQMAVADALIATMQQKYTYFSNMFAAQDTANQMYR